MNFDELSNPWSEYLLPDGRKMRIRHILVEVTQDGVGPDGNPNYNLNYAPPIIWIEPIQKDEQISESSPKGALQ